MALSDIQAKIVSLTVSSLLYGVYTVIFAACLYILLSAKHQRANRELLTSIIIVLFVITTVETILQFLETFWGSTSSSSAAFESVVKHEYIAAYILDTLNATNNLIADALFIWRCYVVWGRRLPVVIFPILLLTAGTVCGYILVYCDVQFYNIGVAAIDAPMSPNALKRWLKVQSLYTNMNIVFYSTSFVTNVLMTVLIAWRIWRTTYGVRKFLGSSHGKKFYRTILVIIESGAIYSLCLLLGAISTSPLPIPGNIVGSIISTSTGIFPTLVIVLIGLGKTSEQTALATEDTHGTTAVSSHIPDFSARGVGCDVESQIHDYMSHDTDHGATFDHDIALKSVRDSLSESTLAEKSSI